MLPGRGCLSDTSAPVDPAIKATYRHVCGVEMSADAVAIDTGGHFTHQCYVFVRNRPNQNLYAV
ncbi:terminase gpA endonuclease subunit, partial [Rhizobacter sp. Root29]|uniref:terminase gpA endonuclease subunit n=1 Tax=Rhizobacter sp. Root29 TaxID=1736511 RepID=UPI0035111D82